MTRISSSPRRLLTIDPAVEQGAPEIADDLP
jgi:hypothetical protein